MTEGAIEGAEEEVEPHSPVGRATAKGAATAAAVGVAAALAKEVVSRVGKDGD
jgi:hypothetical protein